MNFEGNLAKIARPALKPQEREKSETRPKKRLAPGSEVPLLFELTPAQFKLLQEGSPEDPRFAELMKRSRIGYDMGDVVIQVAGKRNTITTRREDFGTEVVTPEKP